MAPTIEWPGGARLAVLVTVMLETWSEGKAPAYSPMTTALKPGTLDLLGISWSRYGGKTGIWRIMRLLDRHGIQATVCASANALELFPEAARELKAHGHELAAHSYTQDTVLPYLTPAEERETIRRCIRIFEGVLGERPAGWFSPVAAATPHTAGYLAEEGFLWHGDYNDADLPYVLEAGGKKLVAIPHSDFTDNRVLRASPRDFYEAYRGTFDYLYRDEPGAMINLTIHAHFGGRPLMSAVISEVLAYMKGFPGVWFARHDEAANQVLRKTAAL
jgi:peptidoglycan/xylan/chitin deacetylase (PgdA/CDA1 family)